MNQDKQTTLALPLHNGAKLMGFPPHQFAFKCKLVTMKIESSTVEESEEQQEPVTETPEQSIKKVNPFSVVKNE